ncbi:hypothetical protein Lal_00013077 [Lupinus albus]|nr:hypothetical protein Lal_00013077 [Lupinus albus]
MDGTVVRDPRIYYITIAIGMFQPVVSGNRIPSKPNNVSILPDARPRKFCTKGGDPAAPSDTATLLRLHPNHRPTFDGWLLSGYPTGFGCFQLSWCDGRCVQGPGTYSPQHADLRLLAIPTSRRRTFTQCQVLVRFFALRRIKPHTPPLVRAPVNSFEFQPCGRTPQAGRGRYPLHLVPSFTARITGVSNPVHFPGFRASASDTVQKVAFATGVPPNIYAFHRYTGIPLSSPVLKINSFHSITGLSPALLKQTYLPAYALFTPNNSGQRSPPTYYRGCWHLTELYNPKTFFTHAALLRQTFVHCGRFPTAASRRSLGRVSVPVWPFILSDRLLIVALVSFYLSN